MILDASPIYTDLEVNHAIKHPIIFRQFVRKEKNISLYSHTILNVYTSNNSFSVTVEKQKLRPTTKRIKSAMFTMGSGVISKALK